MKLLIYYDKCMNISIYIPAT